MFYQMDHSICGIMLTFVSLLSLFDCILRTLELMASSTGILINFYNISQFFFWKNGSVSTTACTHLVDDGGLELAQKPSNIIRIELPLVKSSLPSSKKFISAPFQFIFTVNERQLNIDESNLPVSPYIVVSIPLNDTPIHQIECGELVVFSLCEDKID